MDCFGEEGHNGVSVVRLVELCLIQPIDEDDEVLLRADLPLWQKKRGTKDDFGNSRLPINYHVSRPHLTAFLSWSLKTSERLLPDGSVTFLSQPPSHFHFVFEDEYWQMCLSPFKIKAWDYINCKGLFGSLRKLIKLKVIWSWLYWVHCAQEASHIWAKESSQRINWMLEVWRDVKTHLCLNEANTIKSSLMSAFYEATQTNRANK